MKIKRVIIVIILYLMTISINGYSQNKYNVISNGSSRVEDGRMIAAFFIYTQSELNNFREKIFDDFGKPEIVEYSMVWDSVQIKKWSRFDIIMTIGIYHVNGFDESWTMICITIEDINKKELLKLKTKSYRRIKRYFKKVIKNTVET